MPDRIKGDKHALPRYAFTVASGQVYCCLARRREHAHLDEQVGMPVQACAIQSQGPSGGVVV